MDVTRRYCQNLDKHAKERTKCSEAQLLFILAEIRATRRRDMNKDEKFKLEGEDSRETRELRHYYVQFLVKEVSRLVVPGAECSKSAAQLADEQKQRERQQEMQAHLLARNPSRGNDPSHTERYNYRRERRDPQ